MSTRSEAMADFDYWLDKALRLEQEAKVCRKRAQAAKDSAEGTPGKTVLEKKAAA